MPDPGTRVRVADVDGTELGLGTLISETPIEGLPFTTPKIQLDSGRIIYGYECWWTPVSAISDGGKPS